MKKMITRHMMWTKKNWTYSLPPATKLGQGNIFSSVCQEFCTRGDLPHCILRYHPPGPDPPEPDPPRRYGQQAGGTNPTGMHSCCRVISVLFLLKDVIWIMECFLKVDFLHCTSQCTLSEYKGEKQQLWNETVSLGDTAISLHTPVPT